MNRFNGLRQIKNMAFEFIDIHHHILYGVDDGPQSYQEMLDMLRIAYEDGIKTIIATPHISPGIKPFQVDAFETKVAEARWFCELNGYDLDIHLGSEIYYNDYAERFLAERKIPTLAGSNKVLLEFAEHIGFDELERAIQTTLRCGLVPVLAHVERYHKIIFSPRKLEQLKEIYNPFLQIDADCLLHERKHMTNRVLKQLLRKGAIDFVSSDAHDTEKRRCNLSGAYTKLIDLVGEDCADQLTCNHCTINDFINA